MIRANLFTFNLKKFSLFYEVVGVIVLVGIMVRYANYILVDDTYSYTRIMFHEMYTQSENIDTLFLGSSHCYRSFDTSITDQYLGNTFNAGSSSQALDGSYSLLVEVGKRNDLKKVFLEMYYEVVEEKYKERTELTSTYIISDYMQPSFNKYRYILNASSRDYWINGLIPARRNWQNIFDNNIIVSNIKNKQSPKYLNYEYLDYGQEYYAGKGYVANEGILNVDNYKNVEYAPIRQNHISEDNLAMLYKIIEYCDENSIELSLVVAPMPQFRLERIGNYSDYSQQIEGLVDDNKIELYDFNLCREEFKFDDVYFVDDNHLNKAGAEKFSTLFSKIFTGEIKKEDVWSFH